jgi:arsenate reductase-like glutaredoxin family protein
LADNDVSIGEQIPASKKLSEKDARELMKSASKLHVAKGKKLSEFSAGAKPDAEAVAAMLGPTGNLRAPTIVRGKTLIVGFNEDLYAKLFG